MANPYIGQVSIFGFPFAPRYWAYCDGSTVPLNQYTSLFALIGTLFGGDGRTNIGLPNLSGTAPCGTGQGTGLTNRQLGQVFGSATVLLDQTTMPAHMHGANDLVRPRGSGNPTEAPSATSGLTVSNGVNLYSDGGANAIMSPTECSLSGGNSPHNNLQPYIGMNYCIALSGTYPYFD